MRVSAAAVMSPCLMSLCLLTLLTAFPAAAAERIRIHGSNTIGETLAPALVDAWLRARGARQVESVETGFDERRLRADIGGTAVEIEIHAHGSSTAFSGLLDGDADIGMSSRPINADELARTHALGRLDSPQQEIVLALDGLAVIVHPRNPVATLRVDQVQAIFSGALRDWAQVGGDPGPIRLHARDERSGTWDTFNSLVLRGRPLAAATQRYESTRDLSTAVAADPRAIGFVGVAGVGAARALAVSDGGRALRPDEFEVAVEDYPLSRRLFLYVPQQASARVGDLLAFAVGADGQSVVRRSGFVAQSIRAYAAPLPDGVPSEYADMTRSAQRLSLNLRFAPGTALIDGKALADLDRLVRWMGQAENRGRPLYLFGFTDSHEVLPIQALQISVDRTDVIAHHLRSRGIDARRARGFGGTVPVADDASATGRHRNRRVEVWVGEPPPQAAVTRPAAFRR